MKKTCYKCDEDIVISNFNKNKSNKDGLNSMCKDCEKSYKQKHYQANKEKLIAKSKLHYQANKEQIAKTGKEHYLKNKEKITARNKEYRDANKERCAEISSRWYQDNKQRTKDNVKRWNEANQDKRNAYSAKRNAAKLQRTVPWANLDKIKEYYTEAQRITQETGIEHHVDHIIPLQGYNVSGLHVENNLQILTATENCSKSNKY